jgi:hypothetical protein
MTFWPPAATFSALFVPFIDKKGEMNVRLVAFE